LKKVSGKKQRDAAVEEKERQEKKSKAAAEEKENRVQEVADTQDLFGDKDNEDVIF
jgi:V-type H+-transporting ATPase subunit D